MRNLKLLTILAGLGATLTLSTGCGPIDDTEEPDSCSASDPCNEGFTCDIAEGATEGECVAVEPVACAADNLCADGYACTIPTDATDGVGACETTCSAELACVGAFACTEAGVCEALPAYTYVAIRSETTDTGDLGTNTPGPDLDAISLVHEGTEVFATEILAFHQGAGGDGDDRNANADQMSIIGANDAIPGGGSACVTTEDPDGLFWSMGGTEGFVVVRFEGELAEGDTLRIYELDHTPATCPNLGTERADAYGLSMARANVDTTVIAAAADLDGWMNLGSSAATGGMTEVTISFE